MKNVEDRHGGPGTVLTETGEEAGRLLAYRLRSRLAGRPVSVYAHSVPQVAQTAKVLGDVGSWQVIADDRLRGLNLGRLAGLSRAEAAARHPEAASRLEAWRAGEITLDSLRLPDAERVTEFRSRVEAAVREALEAQSGDIILVGTRSTLIMLWNLLELGDQFSFARYRVREFSPAGTTVWRLQAGCVAVESTNLPPEEV